MIKKQTITDKALLLQNLSIYLESQPLPTLANTKKALTKKVSFSSHPKAKVSCPWPLGTAYENSERDTGKILAIKYHAYEQDRP